MIFVRYRFDDEIFNNTLLEGELLKDKSGKWSFIIEDIHVFCNKQMSKYSNFIDRIDAIYKMMNDMYTPDKNLETIPLYVKKYFTYNDVNYLQETYINEINYNFQGVYFTYILSKHPRLIFLTNCLEGDKKITENRDNSKKPENNLDYSKKTDNKQNNTFILQKPNEEKLEMTLQNQISLKINIHLKLQK